MNTESIYTIFGLALGWTTLMVVLMIYYKSTKDRRYDYERNRVELEKLRSTYESRMYEMMERMISSEDRWKSANHLLISAQDRQGDKKPKSVILNDFLRLNGVSEDDVVEDPELVFVLTPFHREFEGTFEKIKSACNDIGLTCVRGDEHNVKGDILTHVLKQISRSGIIIANIDGRNPNVFYELGLAHAMNKSVLLVARSLKHVPFDLRSNMILLWNSHDELQQKIKDSVSKLLVKRNAQQGGAGQRR